MATFSLNRQLRRERLMTKLNIPNKIFKHLLEVEQSNETPDYTPQGLAWLRSDDRKDVILWFVKICRRRVDEEFVDCTGVRTVEKLRFTCISTLFSAVSYMDRILSKVYVGKFEFVDIQPMLLACLLLASKIHDSVEICVWQKILDTVDGMQDITIAEVIDQEARIFCQLDGKLDHPTIIDFLRLQQQRMSNRVRRQSNFFAIRLLFEPQFLYRYRPSILATTIMTLVNPSENYCTWFGWGNKLEEINEQVARLLNVFITSMRAMGSSAEKWAPRGVLQFTDAKVRTQCEKLVQEYELQPVVEARVPLNSTVGHRVPLKQGHKQSAAAAAADGKQPHKRRRSSSAGTREGAENGQDDMMEEDLPCPAGKKRVKTEERPSVPTPEKTVVPTAHIPPVSEIANPNNDPVPSKGGKKYAEKQ